MNKFKKALYVLVGLVSMILGCIGVVLPVIPTTPFLLLASFCFVKGSSRFDKWFKETTLYKKHLDDFVKHRAMTRKQKIVILLFADCMMMIPFVMVDSLPMRISLLAVMAIKYYYFMCHIKTIPNK
ncbi:MAG: YbaN family protein [Turicibacter sp.]